MSCGAGGGGGLLPPVPDLIPISSTNSNGSGGSSSSSSNGVNMGEQRSRRSATTGKQHKHQQDCHSRRSDSGGSDNNSCCNSPSAATYTPVIDSKLVIESRGACGADARVSVPPATRKPSGGGSGEHHQRHRKLDRRREHTATSQQRKHHHHQQHHTNHNNNNNLLLGGGSSGAINGYSSGASNSGDNCDNNSCGGGADGEDNNNQSECVPPINPRVNPIFVWVKQENSRIVDVKCEDYDKRNRILLTKTAQGWRAIPRTETAPPVTTRRKQPHQDDDHKSTRSNGKVPAKVHKAHRRSSKVKRKSTAVQVDDDLQQLQQDKQHATTTTTNAPEENLPPQDWNDPVNIESHLPSHTILVSSRLNAIPAVTATSAQPTTVTTTSTNSNDDDDAAAAAAAAAGAATTICDVKVSANTNATNSVLTNHHCNNTLTIECPVPKICEPSPLDNLLAVAELEFNQQFNQGRHSDDEEEEEEQINNHHDVVDDKIVDDYDENMEHLTSFINSCTAAAEAAAHAAQAAEEEHNNSFSQEEQQEQELRKESPDCDYRDDDDDNTLAMDDILNRLEQSLRSPDTMNTDINEMLTNDDDVDSLDAVEPEEQETTMTAKADINRTPEHEHEPVSHVAATTIDEIETELEVNEHKLDMMETEDELEPEEEQEQLTQLTEHCSVEEDTDMHEDLETIVEEEPDKPCDNNKVDFEPTVTDETDLVETPINEEAIVSSTPDFPTDLSKNKLDDCIPTDLSVPKNKARNTPPPRPQSQSSETMQSPQPSGIPAVPPSPDIVQMPSKARPLFLETMLSAQPVKPVSTTIAEEIIAKEPLNLGKNRESASPTVTCSEEVKSKQLSEDEPVYKKFKMEDITIKTLLDAETERNRARKASEEKKNPIETPKLLELLTNESDYPDPVTQLKQLLSSDKIKIPDPMLIPKDRLSLVLTNPLKEIPRLLTQRPELRLPEVLDYPELLQDPNMLVITIPQLETIIYKQSHISKENRESPPKQRSSSNTEKKASTVEAKHIPQQQNHHHHHHDLSVTKQHSSNSTSKGTKERDRERDRDVDREVAAIRNGEKTHNQEDSSIANDINAATSAMLNQMMWLPYLNQLESMNYGVNNNNNMEFLKMLRTVMPPYSMMPSDTVSQMMAAHRFPGQHFPVPNFNPEIAMWQEAMLQASLLRQRNPYELFNGNKESREFSGNKSAVPTSLPTQASRHQSQSNSSQSKSKHSSQNSYVTKNNPYANVPSAYHQQTASSASARTSSSSVNHHSSQKISSNQAGRSSSTSYSQQQQQQQQQQQPQQHNRTAYNGHTFIDPVSHYLSSSKDTYHKEQYNLQKDYLSKDNYLLQKQHQLQQQQQMNEAMSQYIKQQQQQQQQQAHLQHQHNGGGSGSSNSSSRPVNRDVRDRDSATVGSRDALLGGYKSVSCKSFASLISGEHGTATGTTMTSSSAGGGRKDGGLTVERVSSNKHYSAPMDLSNITPHSSSTSTTSISAAAALSTLSTSHNATNHYNMSSAHITTQPSGPLPTTSASNSTSALLNQHYQQQTASSLLGNQQHNHHHHQQQQQQNQQQHHHSESPGVASMGKIKVKQHLVDPNLQPPKLLKQQMRLNEQPEHEVGSTTASIEEMQDMAAQNKHLWHPLFGNQKSYTSPWNWTTVTATGE